MIDGMRGERDTLADWQTRSHMHAALQHAIREIGTIIRFARDALRETHARFAEALMQKVYIEGGVIRKLWDVETNAYRDHLLRLDAESRRNRFCGGIADDTIRSYVATARGGDVIIHGFFVDGVRRGAADLRIARPLRCMRTSRRRWSSEGSRSRCYARAPRRWQPIRSSRWRPMTPFSGS
ncbi:MAG: hypothetical protein ACXW3N_13800 [Rhodoplanes sp.]